MLKVSCEAALLDKTECLRIKDNNFVCLQGDTINPDDTSNIFWAIDKCAYRNIHKHKHYLSDFLNIIIVFIVLFEYRNSDAEEYLLWMGEGEEW